MFFSISLGVFIGLIVYFCCRGRSTGNICESIIISVAVSLVSLLVSQIVFKPMFSLQIYCESEPDYEAELVGVSGGCFEKPSSADYIVVTDGEFYYYCLTIPDPDNFHTNRPPQKKKIIIEKVKIIDDVQVAESNFPYAGAGVMSGYRHKYKSQWAKFFFDKPRTERRVFSIPAGTLGKGKIIIPDPAPVFVPAS